jgi:hypothetical protein
MLMALSPWKLQVSDEQPEAKIVPHAASQKKSRLPGFETPIVVLKLVDSTFQHLQHHWKSSSTKRHGYLVILVPQMFRLSNCRESDPRMTRREATK